MEHSRTQTYSKWLLAAESRRKQKSDLAPPGPGRGQLFTPTPRCISCHCTPTPKGLVTWSSVQNLTKRSLHTFFPCFIWEDILDADLMSLLLQAFFLSFLHRGECPVPRPTI